MATGTMMVTLKDSNNNILGSYVASPEDSDLQEAITFFAAATKYLATLPDGSNNPESPGNFMIRKMKEYVEQVVISFASQQAADAARQQVLSQGSDYL